MGPNLVRSSALEEFGYCGFWPRLVLLPAELCSEYRLFEWGRSGLKENVGFVNRVRRLLRTTIYNSYKIRKKCHFVIVAELFASKLNFGKSLKVIFFLNRLYVGKCSNPLSIACLSLDSIAGSW